MTPRPRKFVAADFWTLTCSTAMLLAFLIMPWLVSATGLRILSNQEGLPAAIQDTPLLPIVPVAAGLSVLLAAWGVFAPRRKRFAAWIILLLGISALAYFAQFISVNGGAMFYAGTGFWIALIAALGLVIQASAPRPRADGTRPKGKGKSGDDASEYATAYKEKAPSDKGGGVAGMIGSVVGAPVRAVVSPFRTGCVIAAFAFGATAACALLLPATFQAVLDAVRSAGLRTYVRVLEFVDREALEVVTRKAEVAAIGIVQRDIPPPMNLLWGEGAEVRARVRVSLGADLLNEGVGVLGCEIDTSTVEVFVGRAPLAGTAFGEGDIQRAAYEVLKTEAVRLAFEQSWAEARDSLRTNFVSWGLGFVVPDAPTLTECPAFGTPEAAAP
jgi:hypothetical protein